MSLFTNVREAINQEINKIPESKLIQVLEILKNFSTQTHLTLIEDSSIQAFDDLIAKIENSTSESFQKTLSQLEILFKEWYEVESLEEQEKVLTIFKTLEKAYI